MDQRSQLIVVEIFRDIVIRAVLHCLHGGFDLVDRRDHQNLDQGVVLLDDPEDFEAADAGQPDVEQHEIDVFTMQDGQGRLPARDAQHAILALEDSGEGVPHTLVVVDNEDGFGLLVHGLEAGRKRRYCLSRLTLLQAVR